MPPKSNTSLRSMSSIRIGGGLGKSVGASLVGSKKTGASSVSHGHGGGGAPHSSSSKTFMTDPSHTGDKADSALRLVDIGDPLTDGVDALKAHFAGVTSSSQATILLKMRKDMRLVQDTLDSVTEEFHKSMEVLEEAKERFEKKKASMNDMFTKLRSTLIVDNDTKRERILARTKADIAHQEDLTSKMEEAEKLLKTGREVNEVYTDKITKLEPYAHYLHKIVAIANSRGAGEISDKLTKPTDIMERHHQLLTTNKDLYEQGIKTEKQRDAISLSQRALQKRMADMTLSSTNTKQDLHMKLESLGLTSSTLEATAEEAEGLVRRSYSVSGVTDSSLRNLFSRVLATAPPSTTQMLLAGFADSSASSSSSSSSSSSASTTSSTGGALNSSRGGGGKGVGATGSSAASSNFRNLSLAQIMCAIGDRIDDLGAIVQEYPAWKENTQLEKENAQKAKAALLNGDGPVSISGKGSSSSSATSSATMMGRQSVKIGSSSTMSKSVSLTGQSLSSNQVSLANIHSISGFGPSSAANPSGVRTAMGDKRSIVTSPSGVRTAMGDKRGGGLAASGSEVGPTATPESQGIFFAKLPAAWGSAAAAAVASETGFASAR